MAEDETENPDLLFGKKDSERYKHCERYDFWCELLFYIFILEKNIEIT